MSEEEKQFKIFFFKLLTNHRLYKRKRNVYQGIIQESYQIMKVNRDFFYSYDIVKCK